MNPRPPDYPEDEEFENRQLSEVLKFYDAHDLLLYANHICWLSSVKNAIGYIPFDLDYDDIVNLVTLQDEINKKQVKDSQDMEERSKVQQISGRHGSRRS